MSDDAALPLIGLDETPQPAKPAAYRVLARKYRPTTFAEMIGQDALVRTLTNAIASGRLAHAFVLTGVRGVGKTTTARILARALNCVGPDGKGGPTADPCGVCEPCRSILADSNLDVMEMDAASRTGVDDIREIIDGVRYGPVASRYKVYIIDEVHMLSKNAFNAFSFLLSPLSCWHWTLIIRHDPSLMQMKIAIRNQGDSAVFRRIVF